MALKGSLDDFNIVNILQMIKLEGKTGKLALSEGEDQVKITFDSGNIIYAEGTPQKDEARIQASLIANKLLKKDQWAAIKKEHEDKLKPYWELLSKAVSSQILVEMINRQVIDTVYYALRWKKGTYEFAPMKSVKYNSKIMRPQDVDVLLMEGCRIADEWTRVTNSIPPLDTYLVKNIMGESDEDDSLNVRGGGAAEDYKSSLEFEILSARGVSISDAEVAVLTVMGEGKTIREIMDSARQSYFATVEATQALLKKEVLKPSKKKEKARISVDHSGASAQMLLAAILAAVIAGGVFWQASTFAGSSQIRKKGDSLLKKAQAGQGLRKIESAIKVYQVLMGKLPGALDDLVAAGALEQHELMDPWKNKYRIIYDDGKYALFSPGPDAALTSDNVYLSR